MSFETDKRIAFLQIGRGGWTGHHRRIEGSSISNSRTQHYGESWRAHDFTPGAVAVDTTTIPDDRIATFALAGPMVDVDLPPGTVSQVFGGRTPFDPRPRFDRPPSSAEFGNAGPMDNVSVDVFVRLAEQFGARIFDPQTAKDTAPCCTTSA